MIHLSWYQRMAKIYRMIQNSSLDQSLCAGEILSAMNIFTYYYSTNEFQFKIVNILLVANKKV